MSLPLFSLTHSLAALDPTWNQLFKNNPAATLAALSQQRESLTSLTYATTEDGYGWHGIPSFITPNKTPVDGGLVDFFALENIKLVGECANFERAVLSSRAPPNLKNLSADSEYPLERFHYNFQPIDESLSNALEFAPFFRAPSSCMPKRFEKLKLTHALHPEEDRELVLDLAKKLALVGAKLEVIVKHDSSRYFPPYLHGEEKPAEETYFDGEVIVE